MASRDEKAASSLGVLLIQNHAPVHIAQMSLADTAFKLLLHIITHVNRYRLTATCFLNSNSTCMDIIL